MVKWKRIFKWKRMFKSRRSSAHDHDEADTPAGSYKPSSSHRVSVTKSTAGDSFLKQRMPALTLQEFELARAAWSAPSTWQPAAGRRCTWPVDIDALLLPPTVLPRLASIAKPDTVCVQMGCSAQIVLMLSEFVEVTQILMPGREPPMQHPTSNNPAEHVADPDLDGFQLVGLEPII